MRQINTRFDHTSSSHLYIVKLRVFSPRSICGPDIEHLSVFPLLTTGLGRCRRYFSSDAFIAARGLHVCIIRLWSYHRIRIGPSKQRRANHLSMDRSPTTGSVCYYVVYPRRAITLWVHTAQSLLKLVPLTPAGPYSTRLMPIFGFNKVSTPRSSPSL
jgi:hypothetical protein